MHAGQVALSGDIAGDRFHGARPVKTDCSDDVLKGLGLHISQESTHTSAFKLEHTVGISLGDHGVYSRIIQRYLFRFHIDSL